MTKRLAITADDFGLAEDVNDGIIKCFTSGAVTNITLLAVGVAFLHAVRRARENKITKIGVHLTLTGSFKPISRPEEVPTLVSKDSRFPKSYNLFFGKYFANLVKKNEIYEEFKKQILTAKNEGFTIAHIDSHQHIHMVPGILKVVIKLMKEFGIEYVRFPLERMSKKVDTAGLIRQLMLLPVCCMSRKLLDTPGIKHNDRFIGYTRALRLRPEDLTGAISNLEDGLTELGCHPGYFTERVKEQYPWYKNCEKELKVLCDKNFVDEIKKNSIELVSY